MFKLDLEKADEPEIKLPTSAGSSKKQEFQKNIYFCFINYAKASHLWSILCGSNKMGKILKELDMTEWLNWTELRSSGSIWETGMDIYMLLVLFIN